MRNANYSDSWTDIEVPGGVVPLKVTRAYNSRSLFNGMFGFGWCSDIETTLEVTAEGNIKITECGDGAEIFYRPRDFSKEEVAEVVEKMFLRGLMVDPSLNNAMADVFWPGGAGNGNTRRLDPRKSKFHEPCIPGEHRREAPVLVFRTFSLWP